MRASLTPCPGGVPLPIKNLAPSRCPHTTHTASLSHTATPCHTQAHEELSDAAKRKRVDMLLDVEAPPRPAYTSSYSSRPTTNAYGGFGGSGFSDFSFNDMYSSFNYRGPGAGFGTGFGRQGAGPGGYGARPASGAARGSGQGAEGYGTGGGAYSRGYASGGNSGASRGGGGSGAGDRSSRPSGGGPTAAGPRRGGSGHTGARGPWYGAGAHRHTYDSDEDPMEF